MEWLKKKEVLKGTLGEEIVLNWFKNNHPDYIIYRPESNKAHWFDFLLTNKKKNKMFILEIKTKPKRVFFNDTGINLNHFQEYLALQNKYKLDVFIVFVDEKERCAYGNYLQQLLKPIKIKKIEYPYFDNNNKKGSGKIVYFPLDNMKILIKQIPENIAKRLNDLSDISIEYQTDFNSQLSIFNK